MMKIRWNIQLVLFGIYIVCLSCGVSGCTGEEEVFLYSGETIRQEAVSETGAETSGIGENGRDTERSRMEEDAAEIVVYICGAVKEPGVYMLLEGSRVNDVVQAAGGFTDTAAVTSVNLAAKVADEDMICVLTREEMLEQSIVSGATGSLTEGGLININTADIYVLCSLPGIGESKARDIITYREKNGAFQKKEDIMQVDGIKENLYQKICDLISVK